MSKDAQLLRAMGMRPEVRIVYPLGLDIDPSEWTVEHDANFARVVWPWLRGLRLSNEDTSLDLYTDIILRYPYQSCHFDPNPGPTMCKAIYAVLCGEGE